VPLEDVTLRQADTAMTPPVGATAGSKTLYYCSNATFMAANALRNRLLEVAADLLEVRVDDLVLQDGEISVKDQSGKTLALLKTIAEASVRDIPLTEHAVFQTPKARKFELVLLQNLRR